MQTHHPQRALKGRDYVQILFAANPGRKAIIFIHGYGGDAVSTWSAFDRILPTRKEIEGYDVMFYGYDGLRAELVASSTLFQGFLDWVFNVRAATLNESLPSSAPRNNDFGYDETILVAHSLGAVIARWALLQATDQQKKWAPRVKLILFAPAHMGANVIKLASEGLGVFSFFSLFGTVARFRSPLLDQLKEGSRELNSLREKTVRALTGGRNMHLIARKIIIAERERIVSNLPFCAHDPVPVPFRGKYHTTVNKPRPGFLDPVDVVLECL